MSISVVGDGLLLSSKGDLVVGDGTAEGKLSVGTDGQILTASSTDSLGVKWIDSPTVTQKWATIAYGQVTATAGVSGVTISSIPQTYSDLRLICAPVSTSTLTNQELYIRLNANTTNIYHTWVQYYRNGVSSSTNATGASSFLIGYFPVPTQSGTGGNYHVGMMIIDFPDYTSTTKNKVLAFEGGCVKATTTNGYSGSVSFGNGAIASTSAITEIKFSATDPATGNLARDSWYVLIGIVR